MTTARRQPLGARAGSGQVALPLTPTSEPPPSGPDCPGGPIPVRFSAPRYRCSQEAPSVVETHTRADMFGDESSESSAICSNRATSAANHGRSPGAIVRTTERRVTSRLRRAGNAARSTVRTSPYETAEAKPRRSAISRNSRSVNLGKATSAPGKLSNMRARRARVLSSPCHQAE